MHLPDMGWSMLDVSVIHPSSRSYSAAAARTPLHCALYREREKERLYSAHHAHRLPFVPCVLESFGAIAPKLQSLIGTLLSLHRDHPGNQPRNQLCVQFMHRLSVALQIGNALCVDQGCRDLLPLP
jgi:hypothetical protein